MVTPPKLIKRNKVAIVSPAGKVNGDAVQKAAETIRSWGYDVVFGDFVFDSYFNFSAPDTNRIHDFQQMIDDPGIKAIFCARGGYGSVRIIDKIDFEGFRKYPKWIIGFSDITVFHSHIHSNFGVETIHGPMPNSFLQKSGGESLINLQKLIKGEAVSYNINPHELNKCGKCTGVLVGGNLAILCSLLGSSSDLNTDGKILFVEDVGEDLYKIDRMMWALKRAGKLDKLAGFIAGSFTPVKDTASEFGKPVIEIIAEALASYKYPVCFNFPGGHQPENFPLILGRLTRLTTDESVHISF